MSLSNPMRMLAVLLLGALTIAVAACGGGDDDITLSQEYSIDTGDNSVPDLVIDGPTAYSGQQGEEAPEITEENDLIPDVPEDAPFVFPNMFSIPMDSNGTGHVVADSFSPGQRLAFIVMNMNPIFRDAHYIDGSGFPLLPESSYTIDAKLINKSTASVSGEELLAQTREDLGELAGYNGIDTVSETASPSLIYAREAEAQGIEPYAPVAPVKSASAIQKGEVRTFIYVPHRPNWPPREVPPDPEEPNTDTSGLDWPPGYNSQSGRLTTIGAHCLVFLTCDINNGHPDTIQFTEARLNRLAREFDTKIYPTATSAFGEVISYGESGVWRYVDRNLQPPITAADYNNGVFTRSLPGELDTTLENEEKISIFIYDGDDGGFYVGAPLESEDEYGEPHSVGSTIYIGSDNFPANDNAWSAAFSIMAHEFQHKLYSDHGLPTRPIHPAGGNYNWLNEGLSQLDIHLCGYTVNSGLIVPWAIDGQVSTYLDNVQMTAVCMDGNPYFPAAQQTQYGNGFLFFLYLYEHYDAGVGKRIYNLGETGETDYITLVEAGAQWTTWEAGVDEIQGTPDDVKHVYNDSFEQLYAKFLIANFVDGIYKDNASDLFDPWFHYNTIDLRGTINLVTGSVVMPGVNTAVFPESGSYPITAIDREVIPWGCDYLVFGSGDGRDIDITLYSDPNFKLFMLPVNYNAQTNKVDIVEGVTINY